MVAKAYTLDLAEDDEMPDHAYPDLLTITTI
jgi:hypothetical protein